MKNKYDEITNLNLNTLIIFSKAKRKIQEQEYKTIKEGGLTVAQFAVLEVLYHKGDLTIGQIMEKILTTPGNITVVIRNLEKNELIRKYSKEDDKRCIMISITYEGKKLIEDIFPRHVQNINDIFSILTVEEKITLSNILRKFKHL